MRLALHTSTPSALGSLLILAAALACGACGLDFTRYLPGTDGAVHVDVTRVDAVDGGMLDNGPPADSIDIVMPPDDVVSFDTGPWPDAVCGGLAQPCCSSGANGGCADGTQCTASVCLACGGSLQPCCGGSMCSGTSVCMAGVCRADCGAVGQTCCVGSTCTGSNVACISGTCMPCGGVSQHCCSSAVCNAGAFCTTQPSNWMAGACVQCGQFGQLCCPTGSACTEGTCQTTASGDSVCLGAAMATAGGYCPPSAAGLYCMDGSICTPDNYCESCGGFFEPCCGGVDCASTYACSSGFCE